MRSSREAGFTLVEVIIAMAIVAVLAAAIAPFTVQQMTRSRTSDTMKEMQSILDGLVGNSSLGTQGYLGDMGGLPGAANLQNLVVPVPPAYGIDGATGTGTGWNGPYVHHFGAVADLVRDAWGTPYTYTGTAQLRSAGPDRQLGNGDDLTLPSAAAPTQGSVAITVLGTFGAGQVRVLNTSQARVRIRYSNNGAATWTARSPAAPWTFNSGIFTYPNIHRGVHAIQVDGLGGTYGPYLVTTLGEVGPGTNAFSIVIGP